MKKAEIIAKVVPATIRNWKDNTSQFKHDGKEKQLTKMYWGWNKKDLLNYLEQLEARGY